MVARGRIINGHRKFSRNIRHFGLKDDLAWLKSRDWIPDADTDAAFRLDGQDDETLKRLAKAIADDRKCVTKLRKRYFNSANEATHGITDNWLRTTFDRPNAPVSTIRKIWQAFARWWLLLWWSAVDSQTLEVLGQRVSNDGL